MNKEKLSQLYYLNIEIKALMKQVDSLEPEFVKDCVTGSSVNYPYTHHSIVIEGIDWESYERKVKRLKTRIAMRLSGVILLKEELNRYIEEIQDSEMRVIMTLRYMNSMSWQQIAEYMGQIGDGSTERKKHDRYLKDSLNS